MVTTTLCHHQSTPWVVHLVETAVACGRMQVPGVYTQEYSDAALSYPSTSYLDDMAYAAAWMYYSTKVIAHHMHKQCVWCVSRVGEGKSGQARNHTLHAII